MRRWCEQKRVKLDQIEPESHAELGMSNRSTGKRRDECLNTHWFTSLRHARNIIESWRTDYNQARPHSAPGHCHTEQVRELEQRFLRR